MHCTICGSVKFYSFRGRPAAKCAKCGSLERHRAVIHAIDEVQFESCLHFAPEPCLRKHLDGLKLKRYTKADLVPKPGVQKANLLRLPFGDDSFDMVLCLHVLEHISDSFVALQELRRVANTLVIMVPLKPGTSYRNPFARSDKSRARFHGQKNHQWYFGEDDFEFHLRAAGWHVMKKLGAGQVVFVCKREPWNPITNMTFYTSISPSRTEHQQACVQGWLKYGFPVVAFQPDHQVANTQRDFPEVQVYPAGDRTGASIGKPNHVLIHNFLDHIKQTGTPGLLINSDIELGSSPSQFASDWLWPGGHVFKVAARHDVDGPHSNLNLYGIDLFRATPEQADSFSDLPFCIGTAVWDYWMIYEMFHAGYRISCKLDDDVRHQVHTNRWTPTDLAAAWNLFVSRYPKETRDRVSRLVRTVTRRIPGN